MALSNQIITAPINHDKYTGDIQLCLGVYSDDLTVLCQSSSVNKWAKYKSVPYNTADTRDQLNSDNTWKSTSTWWKGNDGKCGITYQTYSTAASAIAAISSQQNVWGRSVPTSNCRQLDFNYYKHDAPAPCSGLGASTAALEAGSTLRIQLGTSADDGLSLKFSHFGSFDNYYYTAIIADGNGSIKLLHSSPYHVGDYTAGATIELEIPYTSDRGGYSGKLSAGTYYCYMVLSSMSYYASDSPSSGTYIPLPNGNAASGLPAASFNVVAQTRFATIDANSGSSRLVNWTCNVYGAGRVTGELRLIDLQGNIISGQVVTLNYSNGNQTMGGSTVSSTVTQVSYQGITGYSMSDTMRTSLTLPALDPESYMVEFIAPNISVRANIGHDINV